MPASMFCVKTHGLELEDCRAMIKASRNPKTINGRPDWQIYAGIYYGQKMVEDGEIGELFFVESEYAHDYSK